MRPIPEGSRFDTMGYFASVATDDNFDRVEELTEFAAERGHSLLELAIAWLAAQDGVASVIAGATTRGAGARERGRRRMDAVDRRPRRHRLKAAAVVS